MIAAAPRDDEFYIGYEGGMPPRTRRLVGAALVGGALCCGVALIVVLLSVSTLPASRFEFGTVSEIRGELRRAPYPVVESDGGRVWLVGPGKHGAEAVLGHIPDGPVTVRGTRIERAGMQMFEVVEAQGAAAAGDERRDWPPRSGPTVMLRGEIVDSKCFLGVMNPGQGAVHRDCARRCVSGGIPPMLLVRDGAGREQLVALVSRSGGRIPELAGLAGSAVDVGGVLARDGGEYVLFVERWQKADAN